MEIPLATTEEVCDTGDKNSSVETNEDQIVAHEKEEDERMNGDFSSLVETIMQQATKTQIDVRSRSITTPSGSGPIIPSNDILGIDDHAHAFDQCTDVSRGGDVA